MFQLISLVTNRLYLTSLSFTNKTDRHNITEIFLKVALNTITLTPINGRFSPRTPVSSTNKTDHYDITNIVLKRR